MPTKKSAKQSPAPAHKDPDLELIQSLAGILNATGLTDIELDRKGTRVRVSKTAATTTMVAAAAPAHGHAPQHQPVAAPATEPPAAAPARPASEAANTVKSPMVGTVYLAPSPEAPAFVEIGAVVKEGQTLLIIEAMKTMNQINAPRPGRITQIFVGNGQPVEFGEALVAIE
ncbi:acetyl-CoA carboxylase biotin carboxyl carrier protein [Aestuariivirga sp.]|jgi:acetyl-CoA carboxylase biotin carboxyl carrier protein|uniref:acetyl-CoA carboxylase biotin carboxyl carrier protein n=1 Tax=Aestuariivirga sp. TaxID=2650926 RepID=UPI0037831373